MTEILTQVDKVQVYVLTLPTLPAKHCRKILCKIRSACDPRKNYPIWLYQNRFGFLLEKIAFLRNFIYGLFNFK